MGGDIVAIDAAGQFFTDLFSIECKSYKDFDFSEYFKDTKGEIKQWWKQCCEDAEAANKLPFLIFKKNNSPSYVKTSIDVFSILVDLYGKVPSPNIVISGKEVIFLFSDFLLLDSEPLKAYNRGSNV